MAKSINCFLITIFMNFMWLNVYGKEKNESTTYTQYAVEVASIFVKEMHKKYGLECTRSGGQMPFDVEEITVGFASRQSATIEQARELEVKATERFVQIINAHEKIRPFLREYPFTPSRVCVSISFEKPKKPPLSAKEQMITYVFHVRDRVFYKIKNPSNQYVYETVKDEPYEEALKIVQGAQPDLSTPAATKLKP